MRFKILVALIEKLLGMPAHDDEPRADMYLPTFLLAFGFALILATVVLIVLFAVLFKIGFIIGAVICALLGVAAILCWRNQTIRIVDDEHFEYTTFLGNKKLYAFSDIQGLRQNSDSFTLIMSTGKVHIESMAILSERLQKKIDQELQRRF